MVTDEERRKSIGRNLQKLRKEAGFKSAKAFAEYMGISSSCYTEYEQGRRSFNYDQAWLFADALGCSMDELAGRPFKTKEDRSFADKRQECLNEDYESMNDDGKEMLACVAKSLKKDPDNQLTPPRNGK